MARAFTGTISHHKTTIQRVVITINGEPRQSQEPRNFRRSRNRLQSGVQTMTRCRTSKAVRTWISLVSVWALTATCHAQQDARQSMPLAGAAEELSAPSELREADEPASSPKLAGFFEGLAAYTYSDPDHWSRAVG